MEKKMEKVILIPYVILLIIGIVGGIIGIALAFAALLIGLNLT